MVEVRRGVKSLCNARRRGGGVEGAALIVWFVGNESDIPARRSSSATAAFARAPRSSRCAFVCTRKTFLFPSCEDFSTEAGRRGR